MKKRTEWITRTAVMIALLVVLQYLTKAFGQFVTGSCVNCILALSLLICGISSAAAVALVSPFCAFLIGVGPAFFPIVPGICVGNIVFVFVLWLVFGRDNADSRSDMLLKKILALIAAAFAKFAVLYLLIVKVILGLLALNEKQIQVLSASFAWPQLVTALIGGCVALLIYKRLKKVL